MAFSERLTLVVDVVTGQSRGSLRQLSTDIKDADGAFAKMKAGASGAFDFLKANAGVAALAVGTALVGMGTKALEGFKDAALGAGELRDTLGVTAEEASRLQEVAKDLGIGVDAVESTIGRMNVTAGKTPEKFDQIGAAIIRNRDGTVNVMETFLSVVDALDRIPDASQRAAAAQQIFGRGWQNIAELVRSGADGVREAMASVESQKVFNDDQIGTSRELRDNLDELKGVAESASLVIGGKLAEALNDLIAGGRRIADFIIALEDKIPEGARRSGISLSSLGNTIGDVAEDFVFNAKVITDTLNITDSAAKSTTAGQQALADAIKVAAGEMSAGGDDAKFFGQELFAAGDAAADSTDDVDEWRKSVDKAREATQAHIDALKEQVDTQNTIADSFRDATEAALDLEDAQVKVVEVVGDETSTMNDLIRAVQNAADKAVALDKAQQGQRGATQSATGALDVMNRSLIDQASKLEGPNRQAIVNHIAALNGIPAQKASEILALIDQGRLAEANSELANASRARTARITADADTAAAEAELNRVARLRVAQIQAQLVGARTSGPQLARGGVAPRGGATAGEAGPELVSVGGRQAIIDQATYVPGGTVVTPLDAAAGGGRGGSTTANGGGGVTNVYVTVHTGADPNAVVNAIKRYQRFNGGQVA